VTKIRRFTPVLRGWSQNPRLQEEPDSKLYAIGMLALAIDTTHAGGEAYDER
jgi:hypothetical protein